MVEVDQIRVNPILSCAKEVRQTKNPREAAELVQTQCWAIISALFQGEEIEWVLIRYR